ncbi:MAG: CHAT domain-containing protein [Planctomycetes bacterium]|nr:CHAT domain-containing protein [Planctomycetota bacterium]
MPGPPPSESSGSVADTRGAPRRICVEVPSDHDLKECVYALRQQGDLAGAARMAEELLALRAQSLGMKHFLTGDAAELAEATAQLRQLPDTLQLAACDADAAESYFAAIIDDVERATTARSLAEYVLEVRLRTAAYTHTEVTMALENVARALQQMGMLRESQDYLHEALATARVGGRDRHPLTARMLTRLAGLRRLSGDPTRAVALCREAIQIQETINECDAVERASTLNELGQSLLEAGDYAAAEEAFEKAYNFRGQLLHAGATATVADTLNDYGRVLQARGDLRSAERLLRDALTLRRELHGEEHEAVANLLNNLGFLKKDLGDYEAAAEAYRAALRIRRRLAGTERTHVLSYTPGNLGSVLADLGRYDEALPLLREALDLYRRWHGDRHPDVAGGMNNLGNILDLMGNDAEAEPLLRQAAALWRDTLGPDHPYVAKVLKNLAMTLESRSDAWDEAEGLYRESTAILRRMNHRWLAEVCSVYGEFLADRRERPAEAAVLFEEAIHVIDRLRARAAGDEIDRSRYFSVLSGRRPYAGMVRAQVAMAQLAEGRSDGGTSTAGSPNTHLRRAYDYLEQGRGRALLDLLDRSGTDIHELASRADAGGDAVSAGRVEEIRQRERSARMARAAADRALAALRADSSLSDEERRRRQEDHQRDRSAADEAERQATRELFELARDELKSAGLKPLGAETIAAALQPGELLLTYSLGTTESILLVIDPQGGIRGLTLHWPDGTRVGAASLSGALHASLTGLSVEPVPRHETRADAPDYAPSALAEALLPGQIRDEVLAAMRVIVVPDGPLHRLPFEMLVLNEAEDRRWVDVGPAIVYAPSGTVAVAERRRAQTRRAQPPAEGGVALVAVGDPRFAHSPAAGSLPALPGTAVEVEAIAAVVRGGMGSQGEVRLLTGTAATAANLFDACQRPRLVHLATHGLPTLGRLAHTSALVLAPSRAPDDDGLLTLGDLLARWGGRLDGAQLVTLSACRTAEGRLEAGDGMVALTWGFLYAGAESVIASLWKVEDHATSLLMTRLYENLLGRFDTPRAVGSRACAARQPMSKADALLEAKRWLRSYRRDSMALGVIPPEAGGPPRGVHAVPADSHPRDPGPYPYGHPVFWAPFVLIGDGS